MLMIPLWMKMKLMVSVQQVEREGKMLTKAALTMPQVIQAPSPSTPTQPNPHLLIFSRRLSFIVDSNWKRPLHPPQCHDIVFTEL